MKKFLLMMICVLSASVYAKDPLWIVVQRDNTDTVSIDGNRVTVPAPGQRTVYVKWKIMNKTAFVLVNCKKHTFQLQDVPAQKIIPNSTADAVANVVCGVSDELVAGAQ